MLLQRILIGGLMALVLWAAGGLIVHACDDYIEELFDEGPLACVGNILDDLGETDRLWEATGFIEVEGDGLDVILPEDSYGPIGRLCAGSSKVIRVQYGLLGALGCGGAVIGVIGYCFGRFRRCNVDHPEVCGPNGSEPV